MAVETDTHTVQEAAEHSNEYGIVLAKIAIHGIRKRVTAPISSIVKALHAEQHQLFGFFDRQKAQQNLIEESKYGGVCADSEGKGQKNQRPKKKRPPLNSQPV